VGGEQVKSSIVIVAAAVAFLATVGSASAGLNTYTQGNTIYIQNTGGQGFYWTMCLRVNDRSWRDTPTGYTGAYSTSQYGVYTSAGYSYRISAHYSQYPPVPNC
jgi:hypothetical protein